MVHCSSTFTCANSYLECQQEPYCPLSRNFTYAPTSYKCGDGPQLCVQDISNCYSSACTANYSYWTSADDSGNFILPYPDFDPFSLRTCIDGRCMPNGICSTTFSCSSEYLKAGGFGFFCLKNKAEAEPAVQIAIKRRAKICPPGFIMCYSGQCR